MIKTGTARCVVSLPLIALQRTDLVVVSDSWGTVSD